MVPALQFDGGGGGGGGVGFVDGLDGLLVLLLGFVELIGDAKSAIAPVYTSSIMKKYFQVFSTLLEAM